MRGLEVEAESEARRGAEARGTGGAARLEQLRTLHAIARQLAQPSELEPALREVLQRLAHDLGLRRGTISIYHRDLEEAHALVQVDAEPPDAGSSSTVSFRAGEGITGQVIESGEPLLVPRLDREPRYLNRSASRRELDRSQLAFLCVPVKHGAEVVGALSADSPAGVGAEELACRLALLETVADLIGSRLETRRVAEENRRLRERMSQSGVSESILGSSRAIRLVRELVAQVAESRTTVLLTGETGTGKGLVAQAIHAASPRRDFPFVKVNCGAMPESLIESELFGHERGAFTGATATREGRFEIAGAGTIFLDEVGELPPQAQVKLLNVLQDRELQRVGGSRVIRSHARVVAASNRDLEADVHAGRFRSDLYYRLNVFPIHVPPLRERGADIIMLADHFTRSCAREMGKEVNRIDTPAIDMMMAYHWPGNVRELVNAIERAVLLAGEGVIHAHLLPPSLQMKTVEGRSQARGKLAQLVAAYELELIVDALKDAEGSQTGAARLLGTSKRVIQYKVEKYGIDYRLFRRRRRDEPAA